MALPLEVSQRAGPTVPRIDRVSYTHDAMIDLVLENPMISQNEIAQFFGYTPSWVSIVFNSDAFQARLAARKEEIIDPLVRAKVDEAIKGLVSRSIEILREKLDNPNVSTELALEVFKSSTKAAGYGARNPSTTVNINGQGSLIQVLSGLDAAQAAQVSANEAPTPKVVEGEVVG
jgi:hypothetical protein